LRVDAVHLTLSQVRTQNRTLITVQIEQIVHARACVFLSKDLNYAATGLIPYCLLVQSARTMFVIMEVLLTWPLAARAQSIQDTLNIQRLIFAVLVPNQQA
jgi:hypothetical protein